MKLEIRDIHSSDIDAIWMWQPSSSDDVYFHLEVEVGSVGQEGGNLFQLTVATPEGLRSFSKKYNTSFPDRGLIVVSVYTWDQLKKRINNILAQCTRDTWAESLSCLQRYFVWEYEDYSSEV